jgi:hypothetical protein
MWLREMRDAVLTASAASKIKADRRKGSRATVTPASVNTNR